MVRLWVASESRGLGGGGQKGWHHGVCPEPKRKQESSLTEMGRVAGLKKEMAVQLRRFGSHCLLDVWSAILTEKAAESKCTVYAWKPMCTSWNSRVGTTCQSLGFRGAWLLLHPGCCLPHLRYCLSLLFIHSFVERYMSFLCRDYYKVQNDVVGLVFAWHVNGKNDLCQQRGKTGSEGLFLLHQSCWAPGGSFGVWLWVTVYWFSHSWWL